MPRLRLTAFWVLGRGSLAIINRLPRDVVELTWLMASWYNYLKQVCLTQRPRVNPLAKPRASVVISGGCGTGSQFDAKIDQKFGAFFLADSMVR